MLEHPYTFFRRVLSSAQLVQQVRCMFYYSCVSAAVGVVSLVLGIAGRMSVYAVCANFPYLTLPGLFYISLASRNWGLLIIRLKIFAAFAMFLSMGIVDGLIISKLAESYSYCYGPANSECSDYHGELDYDLECDMQSKEGYLVVCSSYSVSVLQLVAISVNLLATVMMFPYLVLTCSLKKVLNHHSVVPLSDDEPIQGSVLPIYVFVRRKAYSLEDS
jgi:hypothetical protein